MTMAARFAPEEGVLSVLGLRFEAARRLGCEVRGLDPETGYLNEIRKGDVRRVLVGGLSPLNDAVAARLVGDKSHTARVLESRGFRVPPTVRCLKPGHFRGDFTHLEGLGAAEALAEEHGYPLVIKPNFGSRGVDIVVASDRAELEAGIRAVWQRDHLALAQAPIDGFDLRIDFLDGEFLFGYVRRPVRVVGDGHRSLRELLLELDKRFEGPGFEKGLESDPIWAARFEAEESTGERLERVLGEGECLDFDTPILNLNRLCVADYVGSLSAEWTEHALRIGEIFSLRHFGIDFKVRDLDHDPAESTVIEVNSSPSLLHMARSGHLDEALAAEMKLVGKIMEDARPQWCR